MTKKVTAILLALILGLSSMLTVFAEEVQNEAQTEAITESTADVTAKAGEDAVFSVKTLGEVRSFQWQVSKDGGKKWTDLNPKTYGATETLRIPVKDSYDGYLYRCEVTFADYRVEHSAPAKLRLSKTLVLESESVGGVKVSVEAPDGALPEGTTMTVSAVNQAAVQNAIDKAADLNGKVLAAADITFYADGAVVEPTAPIKVTMTSEAIASAKNPQVVHLDTTAEELEKANVVPEKVEAEFELNAVKFEADQFSVYVVVDEPIDDYKRATVIFHGKDGSAVATYYVKESDQLLGNDERDYEVSYIEDIVADPGIGGELDGNRLFKGWYIGETNNYTTETEPMDIAKIRKYLYDLNIVDDMTINVWPIIYKFFNITYIGEVEGLSLGTDTVLLMESETSAEYTVKMAYTPSTGGQNFEGWYATKGGANIEGWEDGKLYPNNTEVTISGDVTFSVSAPFGHWLVFHQNGGTYVAPQFVKDGETSKSPAITMKKLGYTFVGWYEDEALTTPYTFNTTLSDDDDAYAKWTENANADYVVLIWEEKSNGDGYDFVKSETVSSVPSGTAINVTSGDNSVTVTSGSKSYTYTNSTGGFEYEKKEGSTTVAPEGNSVVNVYLKRKTFTLTFQDYTYTQNNSGNYVYWPGGYYRSGDAYWGYTSSYYPEGYYSRNNWNDTDEGNYGEGPSPVYNVSNNATVYYYTRNDNGTYTSHTYTAHRYNRSNNRTTVKTITAKYGESIKDNFPIVGSNGMTYDDGQRWEPVNNSTYTEVILSWETMPATDVTFYMNPGTKRPLKTMNYYVEALPGDTNTVTYNGQAYTLYKQVVARYNRVTESEDYIDLDGFTKNGSNPAFSNGVALNDSTNDGTIDMYYLRVKKNILFMDGAYVDGNGNRISANDGKLGKLSTVTNITYGASTAAYNKGGASYYDPGKDANVTSRLDEGFVFEGWYIDAACNEPYTFTTMSMTGIVVYAKWHQVQYRVFLHPNADLEDEDGNKTPDPSLYWGSTTQEMNFRISYGDKVSAPTGTRSKYEFVDWFLDEDFTELFDAEKVALTDAIASDYDKTDPDNYTDPMDPWGHNATYNKDDEAHENRWWITKKVDIYAMWRSKIIGAEGITVVYDKNGGASAPTDPSLYLDKAGAIAQAAATPADPETEQFLYWVVQHWNGEKFVDTELTVFPGDSFKVYMADARITDDDNNNAVVTQDDLLDNGHYTYVVQLRAEYGPLQTPHDTYVNWYRNEEEGEEPIDVGNDRYQINETIPICSADKVEVSRGHVFLGWSIQKEFDYNAQTGQATGTAHTYYPGLTEDDLDLKYADLDNDGEYEYYTKVGNNWVKALGVAADNIRPFEALYAVYKDVVYVIHGSDNTVEVVDLADAKETYKYTTGYNAETGKYTSFYYGGYGLIADTTDDDPKGFTLTKGGAVATFTGSFTWERASAQKSAAAFTAGAETVASAKKRTVGDVYYIKEVPSYYLASPMITTIKDNYGAGALTSVTMISVADTAIYRQAGYVSGTTNNRGTFAASYTLTQNNGSSVTKTAADLFKDDKGNAVAAGTLIINPLTIGAGQITLTPYWITYDNVQVNSNTPRTVTITSDSVTSSRPSNIE
jgi:uncharacterized repeat protein (TIGR02543 family)